MQKFGKNWLLQFERWEDVVVVISWQQTFIVSRNASTQEIKSVSLPQHPQLPGMDGLGRFIFWLRLNVETVQGFSDHLNAFLFHRFLLQELLLRQWRHLRRQVRRRRYDVIGSVVAKVIHLRFFRSVDASTAAMATPALVLWTTLMMIRRFWMTRAVRKWRHGRWRRRRRGKARTGGLPPTKTFKNFFGRFYSWG